MATCMEPVKRQNTHSLDCSPPLPPHNKTPYAALHKHIHTASLGLLTPQLPMCHMNSTTCLNCWFIRPTVPGRMIIPDCCRPQPDSRADPRALEPLTLVAPSLFDWYNPSITRRHRPGKLLLLLRLTARPPTPLRLPAAPACVCTPPCAAACAPSDMPHSHSAPPCRRCSGPP